MSVIAQASVTPSMSAKRAPSCHSVTSLVAMTEGLSVESRSGRTLFNVRLPYCKLGGKSHKRP
jgi:hypothetical protein